MKELTILFLGICCFIDSGRAPRTVAVLDLSAPTMVHGHRIQVHEAYIRVPSDDLVKDDIHWPYRIDSKGNYIFPLDHRTLSLEGLPAGVKLHVDEYFRCLIPRLTQECPEFGQLKSLDQILPAAAAVLDLHEGELSAFIDPKPNGPSSSKYTHPTDGRVLIRGKRKDYSDVTFIVAPTASIAIVNQPKEHGVENHFLAYYQLSANGSCCTNVPFRAPLPGCSVTAPPSPLPPDDPARMSTVACSNSNYP